MSLFRGIEERSDSGTEFLHHCVQSEDVDCRLRHSSLSGRHRRATCAHCARDGCGDGRLGLGSVPALDTWSRSAESRCGGGLTSERSRAVVAASPQLIPRPRTRYRRRLTEPADRAAPSVDRLCRGSARRRASEESAFATTRCAGDRRSIPSATARRSQTTDMRVVDHPEATPGLPTGKRH